MNLHRRTFLGSLLAIAAAPVRKAKLVEKLPILGTAHYMSLYAELNTRRRYPLGMTPKVLNLGSGIGVVPIEIPPFTATLIGTKLNA